MPPVPFPTRERRSRQRGFTLIECLGAMVIIGTALVAGISLFGFQYQASASQLAGWKALRHLERQFEVVRTIPFEEQYEVSWTAVPTDGAYDYKVEVDPIIGHPDKKKVTVRVRWCDATGNHEVHVVTMSVEGVER